jgi:hypothetical protein
MEKKKPTGGNPYEKTDRGVLLALVLCIGLLPG